MLIKRSMLPKILKELEREPKIIILYGPRQAGKTTVIKQLLKEVRLPDESKDPPLFLVGDDIRTQELLGKADLSILRKAIGNTRFLVIDEAQRITNIGLTLKLIYDSFPITILASGSSSFDLANKIAEPLTGRSITFTLYPLSILEIPVLAPDTSIVPRIEEFLRFGLYPKVVTLASEDEKQSYLTDLINNYLYRDILIFETVRKPKKIIDLLSLLALQIGNQVSILELSNNLGLSKVVIEKYLDILEKMFIIVNIKGFSRNLRKEITKTSKYYFVDLGIRNSLIRNFNPLHLRMDTGAMFENFCIIERMKALANSRRFANFYFWRTYDKKEIDLIEEEGGTLYAYEFKWSLKEQKRGRAEYEFASSYKNSVFKIVNPNNMEEFVSLAA